MNYTIKAYDEEGKEVDLRKVLPSDLIASLNNLGIDIPPRRKRLPTTRKSVTHKFDISGHEGYITVGLYEDGRPGELFVTMAKEGSTLAGTMDSFGTSISLCLQYGVPLKELVRKFVHTRFEPHGHTSNPDIPIATSIVDYIFRWIGKRYLTEEEQREVRIQNNGLENQLS